VSRLSLATSVAAGVGSGMDTANLEVLNSSGGTLTRDTLVYISSWSAAKEMPVVAKGDADDPTTRTQYVVTGDIANGEIGFVKKFALSAANKDTSAGAVGDPVYLSATAGGFTLTKPTGSMQLAQIVGRIAVVSASVGQIVWMLDADTIVAQGGGFLPAGGTQPVDIGLDVRNVTGAPLAAGDLVAISSWNEANTRFTIAKADADAATGRRADYVLSAAIADVSNGTVVKAFRKTGVDTSAGVVGDPVYLSATAGGFTLTAPTGDSVQQVVGRIAVAAVAGVIEFNLLDREDRKIGKTDMQLASVDTAILQENTIQYAEVTITNAQMLALRATPKELVAAPAAGKVLEFVSAVLIFDRTAAYTESDDNLAVKYDSGSGVQVSQTIEASGFVDAAVDTMTTAIPKPDVIAAKTASEVKSLVLHNTGDGEFGGGDAANVVRVKVAFRRHTTGW